MAREKIIPYDQHLKPLARQLRNQSTLAEILLWQQLKAKKMLGYDFDRQKPIDRFIVDFFCSGLMLGIEIDGESHRQNPVRDQERQVKLERLGVRFLRFEDRMVKQDMRNVLRSIENWIFKMAKQGTESLFRQDFQDPPLHPSGGGELLSPKGVYLSLLKQMRKRLVIIVALGLIVFLGGSGPRESAQTVQPPKLNRTTLSNGNILLNGRPFPMVLDAGTDTFTPQDYNIVMGNKDGFGANTWWLQYAMRNMKSETEGDFSGLGRALDFFEETGMFVNLYLRAEYRDLPDWFYQKNSDYQMLDPQGKPVGRQICLQHEGFRRLIDHYLRGAVSAAKGKRSLLMYSVYDEFCIRGWGCFCNRCVTKYRDYLKEKYKDLNTLNQAWKSSYDSWAKIDAPRTQTFDSNYGDWQHYRLQVLHDFGMLYYKAVKETDPDHLVWIDINMDLYDYTWQRLCVWWKLTDIFDAFNLGPDAMAEGAPIRTAMNRAIRDNYGKAATWHRGIVTNEFMAKPEIYSLLFESNHGGLVWWYSFWDVLKADKAWGAGDEVETPTQANWFAARELNHLVQYLDDLYVYSKPVRGEVGVFVSGLTDMMRSVTAKQVLQIEEPRNLGGLCQILRDLNIPYEAFGEDQIKNLSSFKVILLGQFSMCADGATAQAFREYVRSGGTLIITNYAFSADSNGREIANPSFGLDEVWGSSGGVNDQTEEGPILIQSDSPFEGGQGDVPVRTSQGTPPFAPLDRGDSRWDAISQLGWSGTTKNWNGTGDRQPLKRDAGDYLQPIRERPRPLHRNQCRRSL